MTHPPDKENGEYLMHDPNTPDRDDTTFDISKDALSDLGNGTLAYVRKMQPAELESLFPGMPPLEGNPSLWALLNADGTPILLADNREAAIANAFEQELEMVSLH